jgi:hypothetical protein
LDVGVRVRVRVRLTRLVSAPRASTVAPPAWWWV